MSAEVEPPELARLIDFAERPREHDWSLRSALVRYAQPEPARVNTVLELVRRIEGALQPHRKLIERGGEDLWNAVTAHDPPPAEPDGFVVAVLRATTQLDGLGDTLAAWAVEPAGERPNAEVDAVTDSLARHLDDLGVTREERPPARGRRGSG